MILKIYGQNQVEPKAVVSPSDNSTHKQELMGDDVLNLSFLLPEYIKLSVNDYVDYEGNRYTLLSDYEPIHRSDQEYEYNLKFYGITGELRKAIVTHTADGAFETDFSLDGSPADHLKKIVENINRIKGSDKWAVGNNTITAAPKTIEYKNRYCIEALNDIASAFETEWWIDGTTINLSRCEQGNAVTLGYREGLLDLSKTDNDSDVRFITRLIPLGSTRNIGKDYGFSRLQLPDKQPYRERNTQYGIYESVEEEAFADIYPQRIGTVNSVRQESRKNEEGKDFIVYYFKDNGLADPESGFDPNEHAIAGLVKHVVFQSGDLNGRDFEVDYNSETKEFEIFNQYPDEGRQLPGGNLIPKEEDTYILYNISMPESYYKDAEKKFDEKVNEYLDKYSEDVSVYKANTDYIYLSENGINLKLGSRVHLKSDLYFGEQGRDSRIVSLTRNVNNPLQIYIECSHAVGKGRADRMETNISDMKVLLAEKLDDTLFSILKTWDASDATNYNVFSALRSLLELKRRALSRLDDDTAAGLVTFLNGIVTDSIHSRLFNSGPLGSGYAAYLTKEGNSVIEVDELIVRIKAIFHELVIEKLSHVGGEIILSPASMKCIRVEELEDAYRCYFKTTDGDKTVTNDFVIGDQARCQTFNIKAGMHQNVSNRFYWRLVTGIGEDYIDLSKTDCLEGSDIPEAGDEIVQLGNRLTEHEDRQNAIVLSSYGEGSPSVILYENISDYSLTGKDSIVISPNGSKFKGDFFVSNGDSLLSVVEGMFKSELNKYTFFFEQSNNFLANAVFIENLDAWENVGNAAYFDPSGLLWLNGELFLSSEYIVSIENYQGGNALHVRNSSIMQRNSRLKDWVDDEYFVKVKIAVIRSGNLTYGFSNGNLYYNSRLEPTNGFVEITSRGRWDGEGDFKLSFSGEAYIFYVLLVNKDSTEINRQSVIEQLINRITFSVSKNNVVSSINISEQGVKIEGKKIELKGAASFNDNVKITEDGTIQAKNAYIEGEIHATKGTFEGVVEAKVYSNKIAYINNYNIDEYISVTKFGDHEIQSFVIEKSGLNIVFEEGFNKYDIVYFYDLPYYVVNNEGKGFSVGTPEKYIGTNLYIKNLSESSIGISSNTFDSEDGESTSFFIGKNQELYMECIIRKYLGNRDIGWLRKYRGSIN